MIESYKYEVNQCGVDWHPTKIGQYMYIYFLQIGDGGVINNKKLEVIWR